MESSSLGSSEAWLTKTLELGPAGLVLALSRSPIEISLTRLCDVLQIDSGLGLIGRALEANQILQQYSLEMKPSIDLGDLHTLRLIQLAEIGSISPQAAKEDIARGEDSKREFKATLAYDVKRADAAGKSGQVLLPKDLKSDEVLHSTLKTISAFLNTEGGDLYIGVADDGRLTGLHLDGIAFGIDTGLADAWQLVFRDLIKTRFKDGNTVNDYLRVNTVAVDSTLIARVSCSRRGALSFVRDKQSIHSCYRRQGNRTILVDITEMEEFIRYRNSMMRL